MANQAGQLNSLVKLLMRRGLLSDLCRSIAHLDPSSPHLSATLNAIMRPVETLTKLIANYTPLPEHSAATGTAAVAPRATSRNTQQPAPPVSTELDERVYFSTITNTV